MSVKFPIARQRGGALLFALGIITLLSVMVIALMVRNQLNLKIEANAAARARAEILAYSGTEYVMSRLASEITNPENSLEINGVFKPRSSEHIRPSMQLKPAARNLRSVHVPALLKQSIAAFDPLVSTVRSDAADRLGAFVAPERWNAPNFHYSNPQFTSGLQCPDWLYFSDEGPGTSGIILGRVAFNIYEISNLLDLSVAGYPDNLNGNASAIDSLKASIAGANITKVSRYSSTPYLDQRLVQLRSLGLIHSGDFTSRRLRETNGFLEPLPGETHFTSRLDLIRYALLNEFNSNSMAFVTAWSRSIDAPSYDPPAPNASNPFAPSVKRTMDVTVTDRLPAGGTLTQKWKIGDAVAARRFPLNRLQWFHLSASATRTQAIEQYFGLKQTSHGYWIYQDDHILTLEELRDAPREPNFFEMLKAAIANGSLGHVGSGEFSALTSARDADKDLQILRIGASIIDASGTGNNPTVIAKTDSGSSHIVCGVNNLPYLSGVRFRQIVKTNEAGAVEQIDQFALPILVNPHATSPLAPERPPVRARLSGTVVDPAAEVDGTNVSLDSRFPAPSSEDAIPVDRTIAFPADGFVTLSPIGSWSPPSDPEHPDAPQAPMPAYFEDTYRAFWLATGTGSGNIGPTTGRANLQGFNIVLEYWNGSGWIPYDALVGDGVVNPVDGFGATLFMDFASNSTIASTPDNANFTGADTPYFLKTDPRTTRGGPVKGMTAAAPNKIPELEKNLSQGDLVFPDASISEILEDAQSIARRRLPQRLFHTVGELGAVFRDNAWETLDFLTSGGNDIALLDYFSITESGPDGVVSGKVGLNSTIGDTLDAQVSRTLLTTGDNTTIDHLGTSRIPSIVDAIRATPLINPADIVGRVTPHKDENTKEKREAYVRALGTSGQTRTWNFFIDLIAQSGQMPPATSNLEQFISHGEYRLWMHVAIDRFTGKVIGTHIESYQE